MLFTRNRRQSRKARKEAPWWYADLKELIWFALGIGLIYIVSTRM